MDARQYEEHAVKSVRNYLVNLLVEEKWCEA